MGTRIIDNSGADEAFVSMLMRIVSQENLKEFREYLSAGFGKRKIIEHNPTQNGIAYSSKDSIHVSMSEGRGGFDDFVRYWDKDGNPIGFNFQGKDYMFDKDKLPEHELESDKERQNVNIPLDSDLVQAITRAVAEKNNTEIYGAEILVIEPPVDGVAFAQKARGVTALARKDSDAVEKSVWFDAVRLYDANGAFLGMQVTDDNLFNQYDVADSGLVKVDAKTTEMIKKANKKLEPVRDENGTITGLNVIAMSKKQQFERGQSLIEEQMLRNVPENSELAKYLEQYPDAKVTRNSLGWKIGRAHV